MNALLSLAIVVVLLLLALLGVGVAGQHFLFGVIIPYVAFATFIFGVIYRVVKWSRAPVPFRIPTTCGQQKSLPWIKHNQIENPSNNWGVLGRMLLEILFFRSLLRNTKAEITKDGFVAYGSEKLLWLAGLAFHWTFLVVLLRHMRFFLEPVPGLINGIEKVDGFFQLGVPTVFLTGLILLGAVTVLFLRRVIIPQVRYISLPADYFPLFLIIAIVCSGLWVRYLAKVDIVAVKDLTMGLAGFSPTVPAGIGSVFYVHLFLVSCLLFYFPFSKLMHFGGVFLSPTRNLANNNRAKHHQNPWDYPVKLHTYEEYEDEFRERMVNAGIPVDKPLEEKE